MPSEPAAGDGNVITAEQFAAMQEACRRGDGLYAIEATPGAPVTMERVLRFPPRLRLELGTLKQAPVVRVPVRHEPVASPGEQGRRARRASTSSRGSPDDPDLPPPPIEVWHGVAAASARMVQHCERRRAKQALA